MHANDKRKHYLPDHLRATAEHQRCEDWANLVHWVCGDRHAWARRAAARWRKPFQFPFEPHWPMRPPRRPTRRSLSANPNACSIVNVVHRSHHGDRQTIHCALLWLLVQRRDEVDGIVVAWSNCWDASRGQPQPRQRRWRREHGESRVAVVEGCREGESMEAESPMSACALNVVLSWRWRSSRRCSWWGLSRRRGSLPSLCVPAKTNGVNTWRRE